MKYEHQQTLLQFARLQLAIAQARHPDAQIDVRPDTVSRSMGYRRLREFFGRLDGRKRDAFVIDMRRQIAGIRELMQRAKASGEELTLADLVIELRDQRTGETTAAMLLEATTACRSSGDGLPGVDIDGNGQPYVKCPSCLQRWSAHDIGFKIPDHDPLYT